MSIFWEHVVYSAPNHGRYHDHYNLKTVLREPAVLYFSREKQKGFPYLEIAGAVVEAFQVFG